jgi:asparagine synthetase B (glutamine-hydrolysing)
MFAFAIVERDSGRVLLGRDRLGIKPLYLTEDRHACRFASSLPRCWPAAASTPASTRSRCTTT